jgi:hypothetical protein
MSFSFCSARDEDLLPPPQNLSIHREKKNKRDKRTAKTETSLTEIPLPSRRRFQRPSPLRHLPRPLPRLRKRLRRALRLRLPPTARRSWRHRPATIPSRRAGMHSRAREVGGPSLRGQSRFSQALFRYYRKSPGPFRCGWALFQTCKARPSIRFCFIAIPFFWFGGLVFLALLLLSLEGPFSHRGDLEIQAQTGVRVHILRVGDPQSGADVRARQLLRPVVVPHHRTVAH